MSVYEYSLGEDRVVCERWDEDHPSYYFILGLLGGKDREFAQLTSYTMFSIYENDEDAYWDYVYESLLDRKQRMKSSLEEIEDKLEAIRRMKEE